MRIVIVEDEVKIRMGMGRLIETETAHEIIGEAKNGREGLEMALRYKPDLIITDIRMPEMDGLEMLSALREQGVRIHAVILTGYAEFDYARRAISLGVNDYLLKPIGVEDVKALLEKIEKKLEAEAQKHGGAESILREIYLGNAESARQACEYLVRQYGFMEKGEYLLCVGYIGAAEVGYRDEFMKALEYLRGHAAPSPCFAAPIDKMQEILFLGMFDREEKRREMEEIFARKICGGVLAREKKAVWSAGGFRKLEDMRQEMKKIQGLLEYGILLGHDRLITREIVDAVLIEEPSYPKEIENRMKAGLCRENGGELESASLEFMDYFRRHSFSPEHTEHSYLKFISYLMSLVQELDARIYEQLQGMCILRQISIARTLDEMEACLRELTVFLQANQGKKEDIGNYTIRRAINYIREHYMESLSLEDVARHLEITPEYLSTLFNKEVGINFISFLKEFRISHAKRLLQGSDMKIYEVAEAVGYHDPKYFMRVFKEVQGVSPGEFRQQL